MKAIIHNNNDDNKTKKDPLKSLYDEIVFEYDDEVLEYCAFFKRVDGYYGQGKTKSEATLELISAYLDTKDL